MSAEKAASTGAAPSLRVLFSAALEFGSRGYLAYLVAVIMSAIAAACTVRFLQRQESRHERNKELVGGVLTRNSEPRPGLQKAGLSSLVVELNYVDKSFRCGGDLGAMPHSQQDVCLDVRSTIASWATLVAGAVNRGPELAQEGPHALQPCGQPESPDWMTRFGVGYCGRDDTNGIVEVPATSFDCGWRMNTWSCLGENAKAAVDASAVLVPHVQTFINKHARSTPRVVQAYFLSPEGVLRRWESDAVPMALRRDLRARDYVLGERPHSDAAFETELYIDLGGYGLVRSYCHAILAAPAADDEMRRVGAVCVDYQPPRALAFVNEDIVAHQPIFVEWAGGSATVRGDGLDRAASAGLAELVVRAGRGKVATTHDEQTTLVPLARNGTADIMVKLSPAPQRASYGMLAMLASVSAAALFIVYAVGVRRRQHNIEDEYAVLRKLQVGLVRTDRWNRVLDANDCAEELLDIELPPFGSPLGRREGIDIFRKGVDIVQFGAPTATGDVRSSVLRTMDRCIVMAARSEGIWSRYYVRKATPAMGSPRSAWLAFAGSPLLGSSKVSDGGTFAIVVVPSRQRSAELEERYRARRARRRQLS